MKDDEMMFLIEDEFPVPTDNTPIPKLYPLEKLEVGQSMSFPVEIRGNIQAFASNIKRKTKKEYTVRKVDADTCRIWRKK